MIEPKDHIASERRPNWVSRLSAALIGPALPASLQAEVTRDLGNYFVSFALAGPVAALLAIAVAVQVKSLPGLFFSGLALAGFAFTIMACRAVGRSADDSVLEELEARYLVGAVIVSIGLGGIVAAVLARPAPLAAEAVLVMVALATLGASNAAGPGRPLIAMAQFMAVALPLSVSLSVFWPMPWGVVSGVGVLVFGTLCVSMARRAHLDRVDLLRTRGAQAAERLRLDTALQHLGQAVAILDNDLKVVVINPTALTLLGIEQFDAANPPVFSEMLANSPMLQKAAGNRAEFLNHAAMLVAARQPFNALLHLDDDRILDMECQPIPGAGWVTMIRDSTSERHAIAELNREIRRCPVTGLPNRRAFLEALEKRLARGDRFSLLLVDLDGFKLVNDRHGHAIGDRVITRIGFRLRTADQDLFAARLGGDEFAVLVDGDDAAAAHRLAKRLIETIDQPALFGEAEVQVGAAIGIALAPEDGVLGEELMRSADLALLAAKAQPGSHVCLFTPDLRMRSARLAGIETRVRAALRAGNIDVAYQPLIDLKTGRAVALEALARWRPDSGEMISPDELVAVAEARGLVGKLRRLVMTQAAPVIAGLSRPLSLWLNASVLDLRQPDLVEELLAELNRAGLPPGRLALEVTETALMTDESACLSNLEQLVSLGVGVAMDDFGAGFSSLERLRRLPINVLKISGSLLGGAAENSAAGDIFRVAASLGHSMGLMLVAEGVESQAELDLARAAGVHRVQGFALSPPVAADQIPNAIAAAEAVARSGRRLRAAS